MSDPFQNKLMRHLIRMKLWGLWLVVLLVVPAACSQAEPEPRPSRLPTQPPAIAASSTPRPTPLPPPTATPTPQPTATPTPEPSPTPFYTGPLSDPCGVLLPGVPIDSYTPLTILPGSAADFSSTVPAAARAAYDQLLTAPDAVGLVAYQVGRETEGVYWNAEKPIPIASVAKLIILVAYAEAVATGELSPDEPIPLAELDRFYLPNFDLGAHGRAINTLRKEGRVLGDDKESILLDDVASIMIRFSSNAASDYLHLRLGQQRIEETAIELGLFESGHSAPCTFLGQFLAMANHTRTESDAAAIDAYLTNPAYYGADVSLLTDAFTHDADFRAAETEWRTATRRPTRQTQQLFSARLNTRGTAAGYAALMARLAQNGLSTADSSFIARRIVEWPTSFKANQALFSNIGYKNGSLPGVLATAYYAYRWEDPLPIVVILFYRDLPHQTYRDWRRALPHDELARWLLADPTAIPALAAALSP